MRSLILTAFFAMILSALGLLSGMRQATALTVADGSQARTW
jgi:hypothetical protein